MRFRDGGTLLGVGTLASGAATLSVNSFSAGSHALTAAYDGVSTHAASAGNYTLTVNAQPPLLTVPELTGLTQTAATAAITAAVTSAAPGSAMSLVISLGLPPRRAFPPSPYEDKSSCSS